MLRGVFRQQRDQVANATYFFEGRFAPELDDDMNPITTADDSLCNIFISSLEAFRRSLILRNSGYAADEIPALGGGANKLNIETAYTNIGANQIEYAAYFQTAFQLNESLAVSAGLVMKIKQT